MKIIDTETGDEQPLTWNQLNKEHRREHMRGVRKSNTAATRIAVLDLETDPFDPDSKRPVFPFLAILYYGDDRAPTIMWDEDWRSLVKAVKDVIENLSEHYIIYAHNGGRFDFMFFIHELRGQVMFKGRSLMSARIGNHELRDSFHILPEKLQSIAGKDKINYADMRKEKRNKPKIRQAIIDYCLADCRYLYGAVSAFRERYGSTLTIGQTALRELRKYYNVENLDGGTDLFFRQWFYGGRVECFRYGLHTGSFSLFDVNSMYPAVMSKSLHPIGREFFINDRIREGQTAFIHLRCRNDNALVNRGPAGELTTSIARGEFYTTIHEFEMAWRLGLIRDIEIIRTVEFKKFSTFTDFVEPIYNARQSLKRALDKETSPLSIKQLKFDILFAKLLLNNAYGKFAQNPRRFKDHMIVDPAEIPEGWGELPETEGDGYNIWARPSSEFRYNNVATAASITGAARAELLGALHGAQDKLYCDTDSIICRNLGDNIHIDKFELGAWDCEAKMNIFIGNGKKLYAYRDQEVIECKCGTDEPCKMHIIKAKGVNGVTWQDMVNIANGQAVEKPILAPTIGRDGRQQYITRLLRQTGV